MKKGKLFLVPTPIGDRFGQPSFPADLLYGFTVFVVEDVKTARRLLMHWGHPGPPDRLVFLELNEHSLPADEGAFLPYVQKGHNVAMMSEAGLPCVADPGAPAVRLAHSSGIEVIPLPGTSSILLALMASGANGQQFAFHGYLPRERGLLAQKIREMERRARQHLETQIFMETPYRNEALLESILKSCHPETMLCVAAGILTGKQLICTKPVRQWRTENRPELHKVPAIFVLFS